MFAGTNKDYENIRGRIQDTILEDTILEDTGKVLERIQNTILEDTEYKTIDNTFFYKIK